MFLGKRLVKVINIVLFFSDKFVVLVVNVSWGRMVFVRLSFSVVL